MGGNERMTANPQLCWQIWSVGLIGIVAALLGNKAWVDSRTRPASPRDGGKIIDTPIEPANVSEEGEGPAILLLHGFGAAIDWWDDVASSLALRHRVIRVDLIGHGGTAAPTAGYAIPRQAQLVAALLDELGVAHATVIGHSMGGEVAVALAEIQPQRIDRMILIDSPPTAETSFTVMTKVYLMPAIGELLSHFQNDGAIRKGLAQGFAPGFVIPEKFVADFRRLTYSAFQTAHNESILYRTMRPPYERLAAMKPSPALLVIFGSLDAIVPPEHAKLFERVPGAKVVMIEGAGHSPMVEAPLKTLKLIDDFIK
jgi:pimeloyl-ACP methyl ester carboxylesterase